MIRLMDTLGRFISMRAIDTRWRCPSLSLVPSRQSWSCSPRPTCRCRTLPWIFKRTPDGLQKTHRCSGSLCSQAAPGYTFSSHGHDRDADGAARGVVQAQQQVDERCLSDTLRPHTDLRHHMSRLRFSLALEVLDVGLRVEQAPHACLAMKQALSNLCAWRCTEKMTHRRIGPLAWPSAGAGDEDSAAPDDERGGGQIDPVSFILRLCRSSRTVVRLHRRLLRVRADGADVIEALEEPHHLHRRAANG